MKTKIDPTRHYMCPLCGAQNPKHISTFHRNAELSLVGNTVKVKIYACPKCGAKWTATVNPESEV